MKTAKHYKLSPVLNVYGIFVYLAVFSISCLHGQNLQEYSSLKQKEIDSIANQYSKKDKLKFLSLLPSVGYSQQNGINANINLNSFINFTQTKYRNKIETAKLKNQLMEHLANKIDKGKIEEIEILNLSKTITFDLRILKEKYDLYELSFMQYHKQENTYSNYTQSKISYLESYKSVYSQIDKLALKLEKFNNEYSYYPTTIDTILKTAKNYEIKN